MSVPFAAPRMTGAGHGAGRAVAAAFVRGEKARNSNGQFYTDGKTIWSYGSHWPLAERLLDGSIVVNTGRYSATTAKHLGWVRSALSQRAGLTIHEVDGPDALFDLRSKINQSIRERKEA